MALLDHDYPAEVLGPTISTVKRSVYFKGALVNRVGLANQTILDGVGAAVEFNTEIYDVGDWFDNSTALLRTRLTVPAGISFIRLRATIRFSPLAGNPGYANLFMNVLRNDILVQSFGRQNIIPLIGRNLETVTTMPIPVLSAGTYFTIMLAGFGDDTVVSNSAISSFAIEAVVGG